MIQYESSFANIKNRIQISTKVLRSFLFSLVMIFSNVVLSAELTANLQTPSADAVISGSVNLTASAAGGVTRQIEYFIDGKFVGAATASPFTMSLNSITLLNGAHTFHAVITDSLARRAATGIVKATVSNLAVVTQRGVTLDPPLISAGAVSLSAKLSGFAVGAKVTFFRDSWIEVGSDMTAPYQISVSTVGLVAGSHNFFAVASDAVGAASASSVLAANITQNTVVVIAVPPAPAPAPVVAAPAPAPVVAAPTCNVINAITLTGFDPLPAVQNAKIKSGLYAGAYTVEKNDARLVWYFANLALAGFVDRIPGEVKNYMDLYLRNTSPDFSIKDIVFSVANGAINYNDPHYEANGTGLFSDSDDSYAATLLSLAARYYQVTCDKDWFYSLVPGKNYTVLEALKNIANNNLVQSQWPNGLVHVFQSAPAYYIAYTQDNVEAYRGLVDFANLLTTFGDSSAGKYQTTADKVKTAMQNVLFVNNLFAGTVALNKPGYAYYWGNATSFAAAPEPLNATLKFYPDAVSQIFPQAHGMGMPQYQNDAGWNFLDSTFPLYTTNAYENDPWVLIGLAAANAGKTELAKKMQTKAEDSYRNGISVPINNWAFHRKISLKLQSGISY